MKLTTTLNHNNTIQESKYAKDVDAGGLREAVKDVHDFFLLDVVKKVG